MELIPILVVEDPEAALDFYTKAFQARVYKIIGDTTSVLVQNQPFAIRRADDHDPAGSGDGLVLLIETAAPDVVSAAALEHGAHCIEPVADRDLGVRAGRFRDPFGFQWIVSTPIPR